MKKKDSKKVPSQSGELVNQHKRMAMGEKIEGTSSKKKGKGK